MQIDQNLELDWSIICDLLSNGEKEKVGCHQSFDSERIEQFMHKINLQINRTNVEIFNPNQSNYCEIFRQAREAKHIDECLLIDLIQEFKRMLLIQRMFTSDQDQNSYRNQKYLLKIVSDLRSYVYITYKLLLDTRKGKITSYSIIHNTYSLYIEKLHLLDSALLYFYDIENLSTKLSSICSRSKRTINISIDDNLTIDLLNRISSTNKILHSKVRMSIDYIHELIENYQKEYNQYAK